MFYRSAIYDAVTLDFETEKIQNRPVYPPKPVGLAIRWPGGDTDYMAWGHPTGNNCSLREVRRVLKSIWKSGAPVLFFHGKFDLAVAYEKLDLPRLPWDRVHDAMFLAFLADPHARELGLKELCEDMLDWEPEEQNAVAEYIWDHRRVLVKKYGGKITRAKRGPYSAGAWLSKCPAGIVEPYAIGDVDRTHALFEHLYPLIAENGMCDAYDRERRVQPIFMENERDGMHVDLDALSKDVPKLRRSLKRADHILRLMLNSPDLNIDADAQLADALSDAGVIDDDAWVLTAKSKQRSVSKDNLTPDMFNYPDVAHVLFYRNRLTTALSTFLEPWLAQASERDGVISTNWNQVRGGQGGTRTGRPSTSNPNFLNIPKAFKQEFDMPPGNEYGLEPLPYVRWYILPDPGQLFVHRDFDGQEMRIFAHYEDGPLLAAYQDDPDLDPHEWVSDKIFDMNGIRMERTPVKAINFQGIYGGGIPALMKALGISRKEATDFKAFHNAVLPGLKGLSDAIAKNMRSSNNGNLEPLVTWGGRLYWVEDPKMKNGRWQTYYYKLINYLCQGSAADVTKEALIRWHDHPKRDARFLVTVYDEINISAFEDIAMEQNIILREVMESIELDLLMKSSGKIGPRWGELEKCA